MVVGGGFAGATAARTLKTFDSGLQVSLIERSRQYIACPGSNQVIASLRPLADQQHDYGALASNHGIEMVFGEVAAIDVPGRSVRMANGDRIHYDRLILSPGIDFRWDAIEGYDEAASRIVPHAWKAGPQTTLLRQQLQAMRDGGLVLMTVPENPYRCPPGPYERASLIAYFLSRHKPRSKLIILDAKTKFSKQGLFQPAWRELYPGLIEWVSAEQEGPLDRVEPVQRRVHTQFNEYRADVLNVIPPQQAGGLARRAGLADATGWCPVNARTFESLQAPGVHIIGDACKAEPMPKSAFAAFSQAKVCAAAVIDLLKDREPVPPKLINTCYSFLSPERAISVAGVYGWSAADQSLQALAVGETPAGGDQLQEAENAVSWQTLFMREVFS